MRTPFLSAVYALPGLPTSSCDCFQKILLDWAMINSDSVGNSASFRSEVFVISFFFCVRCGTSNFFCTLSHFISSTAMIGISSSNSVLCTAVVRIVDNVSAAWYFTLVLDLNLILTITVAHELAFPFHQLSSKSTLTRDNPFKWWIGILPNMGVANALPIQLRMIPDASYPDYFLDP